MVHYNKKWLFKLDGPSRRQRQHQSGSHSTHLRFEWKNNIIFGFALTTILTFVDIKYQGRGGELFGNHRITIILSLSSMLVAVFASTAEKFLHGLLPRWARLALHRASVFLAFQSLFMLGSILMFEKTAYAGFVLCVLPIFFLSLKQLRGRLGWFHRPWTTVKLAFQRLSNLIFGRDEQSSNEPCLPM